MTTTAHGWGPAPGGGGTVRASVVAHRRGRWRARPALPLLLAALAIAGCGGEANREPATDEEVVPTQGWRPLHGAPSPDGRHVAFLGWPSDAADGPQQLVIAGEPPVAVGPDGAWVGSFAWMPGSDGLLLEYAAHVDPDMPSRLAIVDLDGTVTNDVTLDRAVTGGAGLAVAADGRTALLSARAPGPFEKPHDLWLVDLATGRMDNVTRTADSSEGWPFFVDERRAVIVSGAARSADRDRPDEWVGVLDLVTGGITRLTPQSQVAVSVTLDATRRWVVYDAYPSVGAAAAESGDRAQWLVPVDGHEQPRVLLEVPANAPRLSPDGTRLLVQRAGPPSGSLAWLTVPADAPWLEDR